MLTNSDFDKLITDYGLVKHQEDARKDATRNGNECTQVCQYTHICNVAILVILSNQLFKE